jgi:hypothetical protein
MKFRILVSMMIVLALLLTACGSNQAASVPATNTPHPIVKATTSQPTVAPTAAAQPGVITGRVHVGAPPTPPMVVYAVDQATGKWTSVQTEQSDGPAPFTLQVLPGTYVVYGEGVGYSKDHAALTPVTVAANQTVSDIVVGPPGQNECGSMLGFPASPDGRFAATAGPTKECLERYTRPPLSTEPVRIEFASGATSAQAMGSLAAGQIHSYVLKVMAGQELAVSLTATLDGKPVPGTAIAWLLRGADGMTIMDAWETEPLIPSDDAGASTWQGQLPTTQDYYIDVALPPLGKSATAAQAPVNYTLEVGVSATSGATTPATGDQYELLEPAMCQTIQEMAQQALGVNFTMEAQAPFLDPISGESGQGCRLTATGTGKQFTSPSAAVEALVSQSGFTEQPNYQADGPTGSGTAAVRDMALMVISANWSPDASVQCPADKPISECNLTPEQKIYTIQIDTAMYRATFTLSGHWEDATTDLTLDLSQEWKNVFGHHLIVAQGGNKIDTLDTTTVTGTLQGNVATVQFQSSFASDLGTAQITYLDMNIIHWQITTPPDGEYYLPTEATLTRK